MSTIFACFDPEGTVAESTVAAMLSASDYWQPDATSISADRDGHCRIARAALFNTAFSKLETVLRDDVGNMVSANARLDNRAELADTLGIATAELERISDGMLILAAYGKWGEDCPKYLLGDFSFIVWDEAKHRLFCARDHFGVKVLFYAQTRLGWMVTNEHNAFFTADAVEKRIDETWLVHRLWGMGPETFASPYIGIEVLPPAHCMRIDDSGVHVSRYWSLQDSHDWDGMDDESLIELLRKRFEQAVRVRLSSDYPLAAELSEGLDSNGIAGFAARMLDTQPLHTLSYQCEELTDENRHVWEETYRDIFEMHAMHANVQPLWYAATGDEGGGVLENFHRHSGGLWGIVGANFMRSRLAAGRGVRVLLSGWGGDHCVSTYGDYYESELLRKGRFVTLHRLLQKKHERERCGPPVKAWGHMMLKHLAPPVYQWRLRRRGGLVKALWQRADSHLLKAEFIERYRLRHALKRFTDDYQRYSVKAHHRRELFDVGVENRLVGSELSGRMFRIEYRFPMLDVRLVELAYNMPSHLKIHNGMERYMFRRVLEGVTTGRIQWRQKADVSHPKFDRDGMSERNVSVLSQMLLKNELAARYCDAAKLESMAGSGSEGMMVLRNFQLLLDIERWVSRGEASIAEPD